MIAWDAEQKWRGTRDTSHAAGEEVTNDQLEPMVCHMDPFSAGLIPREAENLIVVFVTRFYSA